MKYLLLFLMLFGSESCGKHKDKTNNQTTVMFEQLRDKGEVYKKSVTDAVFLKRCDKLAFKPYLTVAGITQDLSPFEQNGKWNRDVSPCYPDSSSGSISFDGMIAVFHHILTTKDTAMLNRFIDYAEKHDWVVGEGEYANQLVLAPIAYQLKKVISGQTLTDIEIQMSTMTDVLTGFRGHLLASYLYLQGRMKGNLNDIELHAMQRLWEANMQDPMYVSLWHRYYDGNQNEAALLLLNRPEFPDTIPMTDGSFGWGSSPTSVYFLLSLAIIEGK